MTIGRLQRVPLREVWKHEALDFTTWLQDNTDVLTDLSGITLSNVQREQSAGSFSVDLVAQDDAGDFVVIENQLEKSDHDHLGKLVTYVTAYDAKTAFWIVAEPRPEHVSAVARLNQTGFSAIFLLKLEAVRIADSPPAPILTLIVGPSAESRAIGHTKQEITEEQNELQSFWRQFHERSRTRTSLHADATPGKGTWLWGPEIGPGIYLNYVVRAHDSRVEVYIDTNDPSLNRALFDELIRYRTQIEDQMGEALDWDNREDRRACKVQLSIRGGGYQDVERWPEIQDRMIDHMLSLESAFRPYVDQLTLSPPH